MPELNEDELFNDVVVPGGSIGLSGFPGERVERCRFQNVIILWPHSKRWALAFSERESVDKALEVCDYLGASHRKLKQSGMLPCTVLKDTNLGHIECKTG